MALTRIPQLCDSNRLAKLGKPGEPLVILKLSGVGSTGEHEVFDREGRSFRFKWSTPHGGHVLKVPLSLWTQNKHKLAHDIMEQPAAGYPFVVLIEFPQSQGSQEVRQEIHNLPIACSNHAPATSSGDAYADKCAELAAQVLAGTGERQTETITTLAGDVEPVALPFETPEAEEAAKDAVADAEPEIITEIKRLIALSNSRVSDLAQALPGADEQMIREAIMSENSGLQIVGGGWVKLTEG